MTTTETIQPGDVIRARRFGNRTVANYVVERVGGSQIGGGFSAYAHPEYSETRGRYMTFYADTVRVVRSYR